jgi:biopolymer transport protein ExbB/TolQ
MMRFLMEAGPVIIPLLILAVVIGLLVLWNAIALLAKVDSTQSRRRSSIDSILFWGSVAAVLGLLGQWLGIAKVSRAVAAAEGVNPPMVTYGLSESLLTPVTGMFIFLLAAFCWFFLRLGLWTVERRE